MPPLSIADLKNLDKPLPRYTSYPTAPEWGPIASDNYADHLQRLDADAHPLSLYIHVPFCRSMCLYCGCSVVLNRRPENEERYVDYLIREIDLVSQHLRGRHRVTQLHFGGGTPTKLSETQLSRLFDKLTTTFHFDSGAEVAIEIDPRTVWADDGSKLRHLRALGFNRISFGVQDTDPAVQEAVRRRQSYEMTLSTYDLARQLGFDGVNVDLIYGLPLQTPDSFADTVEKITRMRPDRIALFSYAKVPWLKEHQKAIADEQLPTTEDKFAIYVMAREHFLEHGYEQLGMDHFALHDDPLATAYRNKELHRNFQGYTLKLAEDMIGFGITSIGYCRHGYFQNAKTLEDYYSTLDDDTLPVCRGMVLSDEDLLRQWVINSFMCNFELDQKAFERRYGRPFRSYFSKEWEQVEALQSEGLLTEDGDTLTATPLGRLFIRNIASAFDWYLHQKTAHRAFSKSV